MVATLRGRLLRGQGALRDAAGAIRKRGLRHWLLRERVIGLRMVKTSLAAALAWEVAHLLPGPQDPLIASLVAMFAVQVTIYQSLRSGVQQLCGAVVGLGFAALLGRTLGLHAWTIGLIIFFSLLLGLAVRLNQQSSQVAVTALLVLLLGSQYGTVRLVDTLLGAAVGIAVNMAVVPPLYTQSAGEALTDLAEDLADLLRAMGKGLNGGWKREHASRWLERARELDRNVEEARAAITRGEESILFNPRWWQGRSARADHGQRLMTLDRVATEVRGIARSLLELTESAAPEQEGPLSRADDAGLCTHRPLGELLLETAAALDQYAGVLRTGPSEAGSRQKLDAAVTSSRELRRHMARRIHEEMAEEPLAWPVYGSVLSDARRILHEIGTEQAQAEPAGRRPDQEPLAGRIGIRVRHLRRRASEARRRGRSRPIRVERG